VAGHPTRWYSYLIVGLFGVVVMVVTLVVVSVFAALFWSSAPDMTERSILPVLINSLVGAALYGAIAFLSAALWPDNGWRWGLVLIAPLAVILALSVAFAGYVAAFFRNDFPVLVICFTAASAGAHLGKIWIRRVRSKLEG